MESSFRTLPPTSCDHKLHTNVRQNDGFLPFLFVCPLGLGVACLFWPQGALAKTLFLHRSKCGPFGVWLKWRLGIPVGCPCPSFAFVDGCAIVCRHFAWTQNGGGFALGNWRRRIRGACIWQSHEQPKHFSRTTGDVSGEQRPMTAKALVRQAVLTRGSAEFGDD